MLGLSSFFHSFHSIPSLPSFHSFHSISFISFLWESSSFGILVVSGLFVVNAEFRQVVDHLPCLGAFWGLVNSWRQNSTGIRLRSWRTGRRTKTATYTSRLSREVEKRKEGNKMPSWDLRDPCDWTGCRYGNVPISSGILRYYFNEFGRKQPWWKRMCVLPNTGMVRWKRSSCVPCCTFRNLWKMNPVILVEVHCPAAVTGARYQRWRSESIYPER